MMLLEHRPLLLLHTFLIKTRLAKTGQELGEEFLFLTLSVTLWFKWADILYQ